MRGYREKLRKKKLLRVELWHWALAVGWAGLILFFAVLPRGSWPMARCGISHISPTLEGIFHIGEFAILTALILVPLNKRKLNLGSAIIWGVTMSFSVALLSEFSQSLFSSDRLFAWIDLAMNGIGIVVVLLFHTAKVTRRQTGKRRL